MIVTRNTVSMEWTPAAVRSVIERGGIADWRRLFGDAARSSKVLLLLEQQVSQPTPPEFAEETNPYFLAAHLVAKIKETNQGPVDSDSANKN